MARQVSGKTRVRCVKRYSLRLNLGKWRKLEAIAHAYGQQKNEFLKEYSGLRQLHTCFCFREVRNDLVASEYASPFALQARQWKLALKDALETLDRYWAALSSAWQQTIGYDTTLSSEEKRYLWDATASRPNLNKFLLCALPTKLSESEQRHCHRFLRTLIAQTVKRPPRVHIERSFLAEPETYRVFEHNSAQYISLTSREAGKRLVIPLSGMSKIEGQVRVVLDFAKRRIEVHQAIEFAVGGTPKKRDKIGIDLGITEVFTDSENDRWGKEFGRVVQKCSDEQLQKGRCRNRLHSLAKQRAKAGKRDQAASIRRWNLGRKKLAARTRRRRLELERQVNTALNRFHEAKSPSTIVYENLSHLRGKAKSKKLSRLVSAWVRTTVFDRLNFKAEQRGSLLVAVNPAYSSCGCPLCGWVDKGNRNGDTFSCRFCRHKTEADYAAALEILRRENDPDITLSLPKEQVRLLLLARFRRRLESKALNGLLSQANWESVREVFGESVDVIRQSLDAEVQREPIATVPGKTPGVLKTATSPPKRKGARARKENLPESETNFRPCPKLDFPT